MSTSPSSIIMSQGNDPVPDPSHPVLLPPNCHSELPPEPQLILSQLTPEQYCVAERARQELKCIEHQARVRSRIQYPLVPLPRAQSNIRSVKRTRFVRKEVERIITEKIREKHERNRELDRLLEIEKRKHLLLKTQAEELQKLPDVQPELVRVEHETPEYLAQEFLAEMGAENDDSPSTSLPALELLDLDDNFEPESGGLTNNHQDFPRWNDALPDCEPSHDPRVLLDPLWDPPEEPEWNLLPGEDGPNEVQLANHQAVNFDAVNQEYNE